MTDKRPIRILCVDDNALLVQAVRLKLELESDFECVGCLASADELVDRAGRSGADIILLDVEMPGRSPFEALAELIEKHPGVRTIMLSAHLREEYIGAAVNAGAWGYLCKADSPDEIVRAVRRVLEGEFTLGPAVLEHCRRARSEIEHRPGRTPNATSTPLSGAPGRGRRAERASTDPPAPRRSPFSEP